MAAKPRPSYTPVQWGWVDLELHVKKKKEWATPSMQYDFPNVLNSSSCILRWKTMTNERMLLALPRQAQDAPKQPAGLFWMIALAGGSRSSKRSLTLATAPGLRQAVAMALRLCSGLGHGRLLSRTDIWSASVAARH